MSTGQSNEPGRDNATPKTNFDQTAGKFSDPDAAFWSSTEKWYDLGNFTPTAITNGDHLVDEKQMLDDLTYFIRRTDSIESFVDEILHKVFDNQLALIVNDPELTELVSRTYHFLTKIVSIGIHSGRAGGISQYDRLIRLEKKAARKSRRKTN